MLQGGLWAVGVGRHFGFAGVAGVRVRGPSGLAIVEGPWMVWPGTWAISTVHVVDCRGSRLSVVLKFVLMIFSPGKYFI